jgi:hypothetical protein
MIPKVTKRIELGPFGALLTARHVGEANPTCAIMQVVKTPSRRIRPGAERRAAARRELGDWYSAKFRTFEEMAEADREEAALMAPEERLRLVFLLSGQLAEGASTSRDAWPVGILRFGADPE